MVFQMERREVLAGFAASFFGVWFASFLNPKRAKADEKGQGSIRLEGARRQTGRPFGGRALSHGCLRDRG